MVGSQKAALAITALLLAAACDSATAPMNSNAAPTSAPRSITASSAASTPMPSVDTAPASTSTYRARTQATIAVANPDGLVATLGALWVKTDDGRVVRIDQRTDEVTDEIRVDHVSDPSDYCQGIGYDGTALWACATRDHTTAIARIDPRSRRVTRVVRPDKVFDQLTLPSTARGVWVLANDGAHVSVVDPRGHITKYPLTPDTRYLQAAAWGDRVIATSLTENEVIVIDATSGKVQGSTELDAPRVAAVSAAGIWVDTADGLTRLTDDLHVSAVYEGLVAGADGDVFANADAVWLRGYDGTIDRIDPASGAVTDQISPQHALSGGSLIVAFGSIWTTENDEGRVIRLEL